MKLVIVGNGVAGITVARNVSERLPAADISIYSQEHHPYYTRPRLIDVLAGRVSPDSIFLYDDNWYAQRRIRVCLGCPVMAIDPPSHTLTLADGTLVPYDRLVLATGARPWVPPMAGADTPGVFCLREMADALRLRQLANECRRAVVLGGGLLGLEISAALATHAVQVTVVEVFPRLLPRQLDAEGAAVLQERVEARGVDIVTGDSALAIEAAGRVERVVLKSGARIDTALVVVSAGVRSRTELARQAELPCRLGVIVNDRMETGVPDIYAVGDCAEFEGRCWGIIPSALAQARVAAAQLVGDDARYVDIVPSTTLKVTGVDVTSIGEVNPEGPGAIELRDYNPSTGVYRKMVVRDGRLVGAVLVGSRDHLRAVNQLIARGTDVSGIGESLVDEAFDLEALAAR